MTTQFKDESNQAEIGRLRSEQGALEARLAALEPTPKPVKPDPKAEAALKASREKAVADLRRGLNLRQVHLQTIDKLVDQLCEAIHDERAARKVTLSEHGRLIEKEARRSFANDEALIRGIQRRLGDTLRPHTETKQPAFALLGEQLSKMILQRLGNAPADDLDALLS
jgi:hypothetical protein